ncbi:sporulation protein YqfC [Desulfuribacillus stibiiarsenatis]|uniref:Sporulation protein YqfC n=1 Tax=Desulfuribacillus stibiiarsenatis TaxID=1390249 RepID=A0A1E5L7P8_9FIRM|nr:sporulation protein YqfC [Desulfuribacillus stibiiarsenatis]OEH86156.1 sporulation protein YqfC [Desulfuribacillus stibiiarsenatis]
MIKKKRQRTNVKGIQYKLKNQIANALDLPKDLIFDLPRVTLIGNMQLYIENHIGLLEFGQNKIRLNTKQGEIIVHGNDLVIRGVMTKEIFIEGVIVEIKWKSNDGNTEGDL